MDIGLFAGVILIALILRTVTIYGAASLLVVDETSILPKAATIGIFGGLLATTMIFVSLRGLIVFILDYAIVKAFIDLNQLTASMIVIDAGLMYEIPIFILQKTVFT